jgi:hypothetical protein
MAWLLLDYLAFVARGEVEHVREVCLLVGELWDSRFFSRELHYNVVLKSTSKKCGYSYRVVEVIGHRVDDKKPRAQPGWDVGLRVQQRCGRELFVNLLLGHLDSRVF